MGIGLIRAYGFGSFDRAFPLGAWLVALLLLSADRYHYLRKRRGLLSDGVNLMEIDLVRQGNPIVPIPVRNVLQQTAACYGVCVFRAACPGECAVYPLRLRDRLAALRIPLRLADADMPVDLQLLIDQCQVRGPFSFAELPAHSRSDALLLVCNNCRDSPEWRKILARHVYFQDNNNSRIDPITPC